MPELPEVETTKRQLQDKILGLKIKAVWSDWKKLLRNINFNDFSSEVVGSSIKEVTRRGKNLFLGLSNQRTLWIHLKMTGHLIFKPKRRSSQLNKALLDKYNQYVHFVFSFSDGSELLFSDLRKFGRITFIKQDIVEALKQLKKYGLCLGIEPLTFNFTLENFKDALKKKSKKAIKEVLMDQAVVAGIGNIYASEILFKSGINPWKKIKDLDYGDYGKMFSATMKILKKAIEKRGTSISDFRDTFGEKGNFGGFLQVYQRDGKNCLVCKQVILRKKQGQRSTFWCSNCQK